MTLPHTTCPRKITRMIIHTKEIEITVDRSHILKLYFDEYHIFFYNISLLYIYNNIYIHYNNIFLYPDTKLFFKLKKI